MQLISILSQTQVCGILAQYIVVRNITMPTLTSLMATPFLQFRVTATQREPPCQGPRKSALKRTLSALGQTIYGEIEKPEHQYVPFSTGSSPRREPVEK